MHKSHSRASRNLGGQTGATGRFDAGACLVAPSRHPGPLSFIGLSLALLWAQQSPDRKPPNPDLADRLADIQRKLNTTEPVNVTAQRALQYGRSYLASSETAFRSGHLFVADRLSGAADALVHIAEHQQHLRTGGGPKPPPSAEDIRDHLQRVYFRTHEADYFLQLSHDPRAALFPKWARDLYQLALRAYDRRDLLAADENAKCADEVVKALEDLAQAATPAHIPPPPVPPPRL